MHLYSPSFNLPMMVIGKETGLLSESFVQVMLGVGLPSAVHFRLTLSPSFGVCSPEMNVMFGISKRGSNVHNCESLI